MLYRKLGCHSLLLLAIVGVVLPPAFARETRCGVISQNPRLSLQSFTSPFAPNERIRRLKAFLKTDNTNSHRYFASPVDESTWFVCQHFATQFFLRASSIADRSVFRELEAKTPIRYSAESLTTEDQLPIFYVGLINKTAQYYHAINAIYLGVDPTGYDEIQNYAFIEPQNDQIYTAERLIEVYFSKSSTPIQFSIARASRVGHVSSGGVQYITDSQIQFECQP